MKERIIHEVTQTLADAGIGIAEQNFEKPWGGYLVVEEASTQCFLKQFFAGNDHIITTDGKLSPKILFVAPGKRLSWQYHNRRQELWTLVQGSAILIRSENDVQKDKHELKPGEVFNLKQGERHRLVGTYEWGVVAEIWMHTDKANPSDELDIVRVEDDFGR